MTSLSRNLKNRKWLIDRVYAEIVGPDAAGAALPIPDSGRLSMTWEEFRKPKRQMNGEEILWQDSPIKRYGAGILFPCGVTEMRQLAEEAASTPRDDEDV